MYPTISIITATYNANSCLENLIKSIAPQKNNEVEFVIIDGNSTDGTLEIIKKYESCVDFWISEPDKGIYDAWNKGIQRAKGNWIMFLGADDVFIPGALNEIIEYISKNDVSETDYISGKNIYIGENGEFLKIIGEEYLWDRMKKGMCVAHVGSLHNRRLFDEIGLYSLKYNICADYELLLRKRGELKALFINKEIAKMQIGGMSFSLKALKEVFRIRSAHSTQPVFNNGLLFIKDLFLFYTFRPRKKLANLFNNAR